MLQDVTEQIVRVQEELRIPRLVIRVSIAVLLLGLIGAYAWALHLASQGG